MNSTKPAQNSSDVKDPKWTGQEGPHGWVVGVSRGEPRRTNGQMQQAVYGQVQRYLELIDMEVSDVARALAVQLIAKDHIDPPGSQDVRLQRFHLLLYVGKATAALGELEAHDS